MEKHRFNDCDIKIDHKKEELEIIVSSIFFTCSNSMADLIRLNEINVMLLHYPVVNDRCQLFLFYLLFGVLSINHFDYLMKSIFTWYDVLLTPSPLRNFLLGQ